MKTHLVQKEFIIDISVSPKGTINTLKSEGIDQFAVITSPQNRIVILSCNIIRILLSL